MFSIHSVTEGEFIKIMPFFQLSLTPGDDLIPISFVKRASTAFAKALEYIINLSVKCYTSLWQ